MRNANSDLNEEARSAARPSQAGNVNRHESAVAACSAARPSLSAISNAGAALGESPIRATTTAGDAEASSRPIEGLVPLHGSAIGRSTAPAVARAASAGAPANGGGSAPMLDASSNLGRITEGVRASAALERAVYDARRLRSQREVVRDVMLSAANCATWLTLGELRALTRYGEASISAQLRHLRKAENGGYEIAKRQREGAGSLRPGIGGRAECVWEYRISSAVRTENAARTDVQQAAAGS